MRLLSAAIVLTLGSAMASADPMADACVIDALARLPQSPGLRVVDTRSERARVGSLTFHVVAIAVEVANRTVTYKFHCRESEFGDVVIVRRQIGG